MGPVTYTERLSDMAAAEPERTAIVFAAPDGSEISMSCLELYEASLRMAHVLGSRGVDSGSLVGFALGNTKSAVVVAHAAWWLGACVVPLSHRLPAAELDEVMGAAGESGRKLFVVGEVDTALAKQIGPAVLAEEAGIPPTPLPIVVPTPGYAIPSGGSTGRPKLITDGQPLVGIPEATSQVAELFGSRPRQSTIVLGPLYHTGPFGSVFRGIFNACTVVLMERFDPELALRLIERHRIQRVWSVPAQLLRMSRVREIERFDLSSVEALYHSGAACPPWLKRRWIDLVGPEHVYEGFGSTESVGSLMIRGDEWLLHPGSVGRPQVTDVRIRDENGDDVPTGQVGEIFMRWSAGPLGATAGSYSYWGSPPAKSDEDGFVSVGDLGWQDEDGYVYVADRRVDMIITGGVNVYPAEVETTLTEVPQVQDVAVIGVPDEEWGKRVHAIVQTTEPGPDLLAALDQHCRQNMAPPKVPKSYEFVESLPRNEAGKIRRGELVAERSAGWLPSMQSPARAE